MSTDARRVTTTQEVSSPPTAPLPSIQPGKYSIERILALEEYSRTKSLWHVVGVILLTPLPPLMVVIAYEMPPLQPVDAGWRANWVFFVVRLGVGMMIVSESGLTVACHLMPELKAVLPARIRLGIAMVSATAYVSTSILLAQIWGFPVPFTTSLGNLSGGSTFLISTLLAVFRLVHKNQDLKRQVLYFCGFILTVPVMAIVYPAYMALFQSVRRSYQPLVTVLVPVIKILFRKLISRITAEWEDLVPTMVIFSIELFNSLYLVVCIQSGGSIVTTAAVMTIDLLHTARSQWRLHHTTVRLQKVLNLRHGDALLPVVSALLDDVIALKSSRRRQSQELHNLRLHSAQCHSGLSEAGRSRLDTIERIGVFSSDKVSSHILQHRTSQHGPRTSFLSSNRVRPWKAVFSTASTPIQPDTRRLSRRQMSERTLAQVEQSDAIVEAATVLFRTEYLVLGEYLECIVPWIYAANLVVLWLSPNAAFYPHTRAIRTTEEMQATLSNVCALFALEIATFFLLAVVLRRRLRFSPLHQLSYVLEHQAGIIQVNMIVFLVMSLQFNLDHAGVDFSFQFKWLQ